MEEPIGVVGVGAMGRPIAGHLARAGFEVRVVDRRPESAARVATAIGAAVDETVDALVGRCATVLVVVDDDAAVRQTVAALTSRAGRLRNVAICSSVRVETVRVLAAAAERVGVGLLDAAMTGGIRGIESGRAAVLVGGPATALAAVRPVLEPWSASIHHLGPVGAGQIAKSANNLVHWAQVCALEEALRLVERAGLSVPAVRRALADGPVDSRALHELEQMRLTWWRKDLETYRELADQLGVRHRVGDLCADAMPDISVDSLAELLDGR